MSKMMIRTSLFLFLFTVLLGVSAYAQEAGNAPKPDDIAVLSKALQDPKVDVRLSAVTKLSTLTDPQAVLALITALKDADQTVRVKAAQGLGALKDNRAIPVLQQVAADAANTAETRREALNAIAAIYGLNSTGGEAHGTPTTPAPGPDEVAPLVKSLQDPKVESRLAAVEKLSTLTDKRAIPVLITALSDADQTVRAKAVHGLGGFKDASAVPALGKVATDDGNTVETRCEALNVIGATNYPPGVRILLKVMDAKEEKVQKEAEKLLVANKGVWFSQLRDLCTGAGDKEDPSYKKKAIHAMGLAKIPLSVQYLHDFSIHDPDPAIRCETVWALEQLKSYIAVNDLANLAIRDEEKTVQDAAEQALVRIGWASVEAMMFKLQSAKPEVKPRVLALLRELTKEDKGDDYTAWNTWFLAKRKEMRDAAMKAHQSAKPGANTSPPTEVPK